jgi:hypothetical protein
MIAIAIAALVYGFGVIGVARIDGRITMTAVTWPLLYVFFIVAAPLMVVAIGVVGNDRPDRRVGSAR